MSSELRYRVISTLGDVELLVEEVFTDRPKRRDVAQLGIPTDQLSGIIIGLLRKVSFDASPELLKLIHEIADASRP